MYRIFCDGNLLYDPRVEELELFDKKLSLEVNTTGVFDFKIYPSHPMYNAIKRLKSVIEVYQDSHLLFRGRVLDDEADFYNAKTILCEGDLAFFNDSVIRPFNYEGSVTGFVEKIIDEHNSQVNVANQFTLGNVTVTDPNDYITRSSITAMSSWEAINTRLLDLLGGYIMVRRENDVNYIDYLQDSEYRSLQEIKLGENLLDLKKEIKGQDIITALIPYGARLKDKEGNETDERLTIESVNNGVDYVYDQEAVDQYGWIFGTTTWDEVTITQNLLTKANQELGKQRDLQVSIEVNAVDLSMNSDEFDEFRIFEYVKVDSPSHLLEDWMLISKLDIDMENPASNKLTLGLNYTTFTERQLETEAAIKETENHFATKKGVENKASNSYVNEVQTLLNSNIEQAAEGVRVEVSENYTEKTEFTSYQESQTTQYEQLSDSFNFTFNKLVQQIDTLDDETKVQFEEITKYIRFVDGNIVLGEVGNEITLQLTNNRIQFIQNDTEVAYFSNNKFYVMDGEFINSLKIGNYSFVPRANGSLDFR